MEGRSNSHTLHLILTIFLPDQVDPRGSPPPITRNLLAYTVKFFYATMLLGYTGVNRWLGYFVYCKYLVHEGSSYVLDFGISYSDGIRIESEPWAIVTGFET